MTRSREHDADQVAMRAILEDWVFDAEQQVDILRDILILGFRTVPRLDCCCSRRPTLVTHDREHDQAMFSEWSSPWTQRFSKRSDRPRTRFSNQPLPLSRADLLSQRLPEFAGMGRHGAALWGLVPRGVGFRPGMRHSVVGPPDTGVVGEMRTTRWSPTNRSRR